MKRAAIFLVFSASSMLLPVHASSLAPDSVNSTTIQDGSVKHLDIAVGGVHTSNIANNNITGDKIESGAVTERHLRPGSVTTGAIGNNSVNTGKVIDGSLLGGDLADRTINGDKIAQAALDSSHFAVGSLSLDRLEAGFLESRSIANQAVTSDKIAAGAINRAHLSPELQNQLDSYDQFQATTDARFKEVEQGVATAVALAGLPKVNGNNANNFAVGVGQYGSSQAIAAQYSHQPKGRNYAISFGAANAGNETSTHAGVAWGW